MKNTSKIAVIGGTGKSGKYLVNQLLLRGFNFKVLVRNLDNFSIKDPSVEIVYGDITDFETVLTLLSDCDAVISTIGIGIPQSAHTIFSQSTSHILKAMEQLGIHKYIVTTGLNVNTKLDRKSQKTQFGTDWMYQNYPKSTIDKQKEYDLLLESNVNFTLVRLPIILLNDEQKGIESSLEDCKGDGVGATDLALFLIEQLKNDTFVRKAPFIWSN